MRIAFVGSSGYGNIGDDTYPLIFKKELAEHELIFYNSDWKDDPFEKTDLVVMGGGGIIYHNSSAHFGYMRRYMEEAMKHKIDLAFVSCGIQLFKERVSVIKPWIDYFDYAKLITVRSQRGANIIKNYSNTENIHWFPDLCYSYETDSQIKRNDDVVVVVPANSVSGKHEKTCLKIKEYSEKNKEFKILRMGSKEDDKKKFDEIVSLCDPNRTTSYWESGPKIAKNVISSANSIITGRYHGIVFARISGLKNIDYYDTGFKFEYEDFTVDFKESIKHIKLLKEEFL